MTEQWTIYRFAKEAGIDRDTLAKRIVEIGFQPCAETSTKDRDKLYLFRDLFRAAMGGDIEKEKLRKTREEADKIALENEKSRGNLVDIESIKKAGESIFVALRQKILASQLLDAEKDEILNDLRSLKTRDWSK